LAKSLCTVKETELSIQDIIKNLKQKKNNYMMRFKSGKTEKDVKAKIDEITDDNKEEVVDREDDKTAENTKSKNQAKLSHEEESVNFVEEEEIPASYISDEKDFPATDNKAGLDSKDDLQNKIIDLNDRYLRLYSEFDNYRKRTLKERIELSKTASAEVIRALPPVVDDFERAIKSWGSDEVEDPHLEGIKLISNKLQNILTQQGVEEIPAMGLPFNTDSHEAITQIPAPTPDLKDKIVDVVEKGYTLQGKVIRFAKVVVGS
jgi:molecular chaperone GrpE